MIRQPIRQVSQTTSIPSPTGGLNTRAPLSSMPIEYAVQMTNAIPTSIGVSARKGYSLHKDGFTEIESMFSYVGARTVPDRLFVVDNGSIKDATYSIDSELTPVIPDKTGYTSSKFRTVQMSTQGGQFLVAANEFQVPTIFNGTNWIDFTFSATPSAIGEWNYSGVLADLTNPIVHQKRLWFVIRNSTRIAYGPINSLGGALTTFDVSGLLPRGGIVKEIVSWSSDGGSGLANRLAIVSTEGDLVIFSGSDPSVASSFANDGVWQLAPPAPRAFIPFDGDVLYFCERGVFPLSSYLQNSTTTSPISNNISNTIGELVRTFKTKHGFDAISVPNENLLLINIPQISLAGSVQFALQTETLGWSLFTGLPAVCWSSLNGVIYFAGGGSVWEAFTGYRDGADRTGSGGKSYSAIVQQAFSTLGQPGSNKHVSLVRVNLISTTTKNSLQMSVKTDFDVSPPNSIPSISAGTTSLWDTSRWDADVWGSNAVSISRWQGANASGTYVSVILVLQVITETVWTSTDIVFQAGGILS